MTNSDEPAGPGHDKGPAAVLTILMFVVFAVCLYMALIDVHWSMWLLAFSSLLTGAGAAGAARTGKWGKFRKP